MSLIRKWIRYRRHILLSIFIILAVLAIILAYALPSALDSKPKKIIVISKSSDMQVAFWWSLNNGIEAAAKETGALCEYRAPAIEAEIDLQIDMVYQAIAEKPDAIILAATDYERLTDAAQAVKDAGILLVTLDSNLSDSKGRLETFFVATDNYEAGLKAGRAMRDLIPKDKKVAVISPLILTNSSQNRDRGVRDGMNPETRILPTYDAGGSYDAAFAYVTELLADPDIGGIIGLNENTTVGAARAIEAAGAQKRIKLVGFDSSYEQISYLERGILSATVIQRPFNMGYLSIVKTLDALRGRSIESFVDTGSILITKDTIYLEENEKLLFPFE
ncbi:MAG: substrate-binding domain-containing protein [Clostridiaceae bacterium]|nr:substrate-binding domain-containing protein [Clostridiaceae bacterium]